MIFVTVGTQLPFDRLVRAVDRWCGATGRTDVFAQIADPGDSGYYPKNVAWTRFLEPSSFSERFAAADIVVGHAGMGTIIAGLTLGKPVVVVPRRADLGEHRNDHQLATAERFADRPFIHVAPTEDDLDDRLRRAAEDANRPRAALAPVFASDQLIEAIREFIHR